MQIERVQCLVRLNLNGKTDLMQVVKAGPDAVPASEIPLIRAKHDVASGMTVDECAVTRAEVVGVLETTKAEEFERLMIKYGKKFVESMYPQGRLMPLTLADCELPPGCVVAGKKKKGGKAKVEEPVNPEFDRDFWLEELKGAGVKIPEGSLSEDDIWALVIEAGLLDDKNAA